MELRIKATFSESQKARIVARGEVLKTEYTFEMSAKYAAVFPNLNGYHAFRVSQDMLKIDKLDELKIPHYHDTEGKWINEHQLKTDFLNTIASGTLKDGASCDPIMQKIEKLLDVKEAARQVAQQKADEDAARKEQERPAREAAEARQAEENHIAKEADKAEMVKKAAETSAEAEIVEAEKIKWIELHGSKRLQKGIAAGYNCQKIYTSERGIAELGSDYELDYAAKIERKGRSCPTLEALVEAERLMQAGIKAKVVWLPDGTSTEEDCYAYECDMQQSCEAVEAILLEKYFYRTF